jgi:predicted RNA binding protein YcfA (HicA-like mRNA interferase family)
MSSKEVLKRLRQEGFEEIGRKGSHIKMRHRDGRITIVPDPKKDLPPGTLHAIEKQTGITF